MTVTAYFGDEPITTAESACEQAADSCAILCAVRASMDLQQAADTCLSFISGALTVTLALEQQRDTCAFNVGPHLQANLPISQAADFCVVNATPIAVVPVTSGADTAFVVRVPNEDYHVIVENWP